MRKKFGVRTDVAIWAAGLVLVFIAHTNLGTFYRPGSEGLPRSLNLDGLLIWLFVASASWVLAYFRRGGHFAIAILCTLVVWMHAGLIRTTLGAIEAARERLNHRYVAPGAPTVGVGGEGDFLEEALTPQSASELVSMNPASATAELFLGGAYLRNGNTAEARRSFFRAINLDPACLLADIGVSRTYAAEGKRGVSIQYLQRLLSKYSDDGIRSYLHFILAAVHRPDTLASIRHYERAAELNPDVQEYWTQLGLACITAKQLDRAEVALSRSLQISSSGKSAALAYIGLAEIAHRRGVAEAEVSALLTKSFRATWIKPPDDLLRYLDDKRLLFYAESNARR